MNSTAAVQQPEDLLDRLTAYLHQDAGNLSLRRDAVRAACGAGQWGTARTLIDDGLRIHPGQVDLQALSGFVLVQARSFVEAGQVLAKAVAQDPRAAEPRYNLAYALFMQHRFSDAWSQLSLPGLALAMPKVLLLRACCLHHLQRHDEAIADCREHLTMAPDDADTHGLLALLMQERQRNEEAQPHIVAALRQNPKQLEAQLALAGVQFDGRDFAAATLTLQGVLQTHPECGRAWQSLATVNLNNLLIDQAKLHAELATRYLPHHIGAWHVLAWIHLLRDDATAAESAFMHALAVDRNFGETYGGLAVVAVLQQREEDAGDHMRRAVRLNPQCLSVQYAELLMLQRRGKAEEARRLVDAFLQRPVPGSHMQFRDLISAHIKQTRARSDEHAAAIVRH